MAICSRCVADPAGRPAHGEGRREEIGRQRQAVQQQRRELHVGLPGAPRLDRLSSRTAVFHRPGQRRTRPCRRPPRDIRGRPRPAPRRVGRVLCRCDGQSPSGRSPAVSFARYASARSAYRSRDQSAGARPSPHRRHGPLARPRARDCRDHVRRVAMITRAAKVETFRPSSITVSR